MWVAETVLHCFPRHIGKELGWKQSTLDLNWCSGMGCRHHRQWLNPLCLKPAPADLSCLLILCYSGSLHNLGLPKHKVNSLGEHWIVHSLNRKAENTVQEMNRNWRR